MKKIILVGAMLGCFHTQASAFTLVKGARGQEIVEALYNAGNDIEVLPTEVTEIKVTGLFCTQASKMAIADLGAAPYSCRFIKSFVVDDEDAQVKIEGDAAEQLFVALRDVALEDASNGGMYRQSAQVICHGLPGVAATDSPVCAVADAPAQ